LSQSVQNNKSVENDILYRCLQHVARLNGSSLNSDAALAGHALEGEGLSPGDILQIARRCRLDCSLGKREIGQLCSDKSTAILLLNGNRAAVLDGSNGELHIATHDGMQKCELGKIGEDYLGYALLVSPAKSRRSTDTLDVVGSDQSHRLRWFWDTMWQFRGYYLQLLPAALMLNLFALAMPFFVMITYDRVVPNQAMETLWVLAAGVTIVFLFDFMLRVVRGLVLERAGRAMDYELGTRLFEQVMAVSLRAVPGASGSLATRLRAYENLRDFFVSATMLAIADLPFSIVIFAVVFYLGGPVGWILVVAALAAICVGVLLQIPLYRAVNRAADSGLERHSFVVESVNQLETVKACNAEGDLQRRMNGLLRTSSVDAVQAQWYGLLAFNIGSSRAGIGLSYSGRHHDDGWHDCRSDVEFAMPGATCNVVRFDDAIAAGPAIIAVVE